MSIDPRVASPSSIGHLFLGSQSKALRYMRPISCSLFLHVLVIGVQSVLLSIWSGIMLNITGFTSPPAVLQTKFLSR